MKNFKSLVTELSSNAPKEAVFTFGRFQGLTVGHEKLLDSLFKLPGDHYVFVSQTKDDQKNPLTAEAKKKYLASAYPENKKSFLIDSHPYLTAPPMSTCFIVLLIYCSVLL